MAKNVRQTNGNARRKLRAWLMAQQLPCAICGQPIDYSLPATHPDAFEVDEVVPVSRYWLRLYNTQQRCWVGPYESGQAAALDRANVQAAHRHCNREKSNKVVHPVNAGKIYRYGIGLFLAFLRPICTVGPKKL